MLFSETDADDCIGFVVFQVSLMTLLFQALVLEGLDESIISALHSYLDHLNPWQVYRVGRAAARYGHHNLAANIFGSLTTKVKACPHF